MQFEPRENLGIQKKSKHEQYYIQYDFSQGHRFKHVVSYQNRKLQLLPDPVLRRTLVYPPNPMSKRLAHRYRERFPALLSWLPILNKDLETSTSTKATVTRNSLDG